MNEHIVNIVAEHWGYSREFIMGLTLSEFRGLLESTIDDIYAKDRSDSMSPKKEIRRHDTMTE